MEDLILTMDSQDILFLNLQEPTIMLPHHFPGIGKNNSTIKIKSLLF